MCVICVKGKDVELPKKETLRNCFEANKQGVGFVYFDGEFNNLKKGYFDFEKFYEDFFRMVKKEHPCIIHFRTATSGKVDAGNCHPFPLSNQKEELRKTEMQKKEIFVAHNGVFTTDLDKKLSDTMVFIRDILSKPIIKRNLFGNQVINKLLSFAVGWGKLAFINGNGNLLLIGEFQKFNECYFSNTDYESPKKYYDYSYYNGWYGLEKKEKSLFEKWDRKCDFCGEEKPLVYRNGAEICRECERQIIEQDYDFFRRG